MISRSMRSLYSRYASALMTLMATRVCSKQGHRRVELSKSAVTDNFIFKLVLLVRISFDDLDGHEGLCSIQEQRDWVEQKCSDSQFGIQGSQEQKD